MSRCGMGDVYEAEDLQLGRRVALKVLPAGLASDSEAIERFKREARTASSLNHTNIIHVYSFDEWQGTRYLVMELADNGSLDTRIEQEKTLPELDVLDIGCVPTPLAYFAAFFFAQ
jgi:serine/threonine protein kinase